MTIDIEEALKILKYNSNVIHKTIDGETDPKEVEALEMAIEALNKCNKIEKILNIVNSHDADFIAAYIRGLFS